MDLDLSNLTDDQLLTLAQACCVEAVRRNEAVAVAMRDMMLDEAERVRVAQAAGETEIAAARARERERIAEAARAAARARVEAETAAARLADAERAAERAASIAAKRDATIKSALVEIAELVGRQPAEISVLHIDTRYGRRVLVNVGQDRYAREHLADFSVSQSSVKTTRELIRHKPALIRALAKFAATHAAGSHVVGAAYDWSQT